MYWIPFQRESGRLWGLVHEDTETGQAVGNPEQQFLWNPPLDRSMGFANRIRVMTLEFIKVRS